MQHWDKKFLANTDETEFNLHCIEAFRYQAKNVPVYRDYCRYLGKKVEHVTHYTEIPFLPISFFKSHQVIAKNQQTDIVFSSSGTTGLQTSKHYVAKLKIYEQSFLKAFQQFYGEVKNYAVLALLPAYLERTGSSLVYMTDKLILLSKHPDSGFYLNNYAELHEKLKSLTAQNQQILLLGVTYALLDMAEQFPMSLPNTVIMETGGMKGRRKELIRDELHKILKKAFSVENIHSEYGMTELLSQGYSAGDGIFQTPPWMKILIRNTYDPFEYLPQGRSGGINVIDLANIHSCCFIETQDLGKKFNDGSFTILGRFDNSDIRGCNLMVE